MKIGICTCIKNERPYLREWVSHYRELQFEPILIYDNESTDGSGRLLDKLRDSGLHVSKWATPKEASPQLTAFEDGARSAVSLCDFVAFFDIDEFLIEEPKGFLQQALSGLDGSVDGLLINQRIIGSNGQRAYRPFPVTERFPMATSERYLENVWVKSIVRPASVRAFGNPHIPSTVNQRFAGPDGGILASGSLDAAGKLSFVDHKFLALNHYILKSREEFLWKRRRGGGARATQEARLSRYQSDEFFVNREMTIETNLIPRRRESLSAQQLAAAQSATLADLSIALPRWKDQSPVLSEGQLNLLISRMSEINTFVAYGTPEAILLALYAGVQFVSLAYASTGDTLDIDENPVISAASQIGRLHVIETRSSTEYIEAAWQYLQLPNALERRSMVLVNQNHGVACCLYAAMQDPGLQILFLKFEGDRHVEVLQTFFNVDLILDEAALLTLKSGVAEQELAASYDKEEVSGN